MSSFAKENLLIDFSGSTHKMTYKMLAKNAYSIWALDLNLR